MIKSLLYVVASLFLFGTPVLATEAAMERTEIVVQEKDGGQKILRVEVARTPFEQARGLMFRTSMPEDEGMLFAFEDDGERSFWMKNTYIPLDLLFVTKEGRIHHIHENAVPHDLSPLPSQGAVRYVIEINGGMARKFGLQKDQVLYNPTFFGNRLAE